MSEQVTQAELDAMTPEQIAQATRDGRLVELLGGTANAHEVGSPEWLASATPEQIAKALKDGELDGVL
jgi:hypothetical protein